MSRCKLLFDVDGCWT